MMHADSEGAHALALARSALTAANDAKRVAAEAKEGHRSVYESLGGMATELAATKGAIQDLSSRIAGLERLLREGLQKLGAGVVQAKRAAQASEHEIEALKEESENSKVTHLRDELLSQKQKYDSLRARDGAIRGWILKIAAGVIVGIVVAWLTTALKK